MTDIVLNANITINKEELLTKLGLNVIQPISDPVSTNNIIHINSGNNSEKVKVLPILTYSTRLNAKVIYSIPLPALDVGDILIVLGEAEFTNDNPYTCSVVSGIEISNTPTQVDSFKEVTEFNGANVDQSIIHHSVQTKVGTYVVTESLIGKYLNWICYAASTAGRVGDIIQVDQDYGRMSVIIIKKT